VVVSENHTPAMKLGLISAKATQTKVLRTYIQYSSLVIALFLTTTSKDHWPNRRTPSYSSDTPMHAT